MANSNDDAGCGCLIIIGAAFLIGGGLWQGLTILAAVWLGYLVLIGVSIGIVLAIIKAMAGK